MPILHFYFDSMEEVLLLFLVFADRFVHSIDVKAAGRRFVEAHHIYLARLERIAPLHLGNFFLQASPSLCSMLSDSYLQISPPSSKENSTKQAEIPQYHNWYFTIYPCLLVTLFMNLPLYLTCNADFKKDYLVAKLRKR